MKRVRITVDPGETELPLTFERATGGTGDESSVDGQVEPELDVDVEVVNCNVVTPAAASLLRVEGEYEHERFGELLAADPSAEEYELLVLTDRACYCFVTGVGTSGARQLWEQSSGGSLITVPPAEWNPDGSYTFTVIETVPNGVTVGAVGGMEVADESLLGRLTERQRAAVTARWTVATTTSLAGRPPRTWLGRWAVHRRQPPSTSGGPRRRCSAGCSTESRALSRPRTGRRSCCSEINFNSVPFDHPLAPGSPGGRGTAGRDTSPPPLSRSPFGGTATGSLSTHHRSDPRTRRLPW